jgi:acetyltransferase-like isoleucine patch superfamily enzyme
MAGAVTIERGAYVSSGAILAPGIRVGAGAVVGAGALVSEHVPPKVFVAGIPARVVKPIDETFNWRRLLAGLA